MLAGTEVAIIGDYGQISTNEKLVADAIHADKPQAVLTVGDNIYHGTYQTAVGDYYGDYISSKQFFPVVGNHDYDYTPDLSKYKSFFGVPSYYDRVIGSTHYFFLNSEPQEVDGNTATSKQATWLKDGLAKSTSTWNVVLDHRPPYSSSTGHGSEESMRWPFQQWGADLVLSGHDHDYERNVVNGLTYIVDGIGGFSASTGYSFGTPLPTSQYRDNLHAGYVRLTERSDGLFGEYVAIVNGSPKVLDQFLVGGAGSATPALSVSDVSIMEGNSGTRNATFTVNLSAAAAGNVTVHFATADGTATAGSDYTAESGMLTFSAGQTSKSVIVPIVGNTVAEADETFMLNLTAPANATLADAQAKGTIMNDDGGGGSSGSTTVTMQDGAGGYSGTRDTCIDSKSPSINFGSEKQLMVDGSPDNAVLLKWDVTNIPAGATVTGVSLTLNVLDGSADTYEFYAVKRKWTEDLATWTSARTGSNWEKAGASGTTDRGSTVIATIGNVAAGSRTVNFNAAGVALVQSWIGNPAASLGVVIQDYGVGDALSFDSSDSRTIANRPKLSLTYTLPATTAATAASVQLSAKAVDANMLAIGSADLQPAVEAKVAVPPAASVAHSVLPQSLSRRSTSALRGHRQDAVEVVDGAFGRN